MGGNAREAEWTTPEWGGWLRSFGAQIRRVRESLDLTQDAVARRAGVSQTAVSRLESGRGLYTPLLVALRIHAVLAHELRALDAGLLTEEGRRWIELQGLVDGVADNWEGVLQDPELERLVRLYPTLAPADRRVVSAVLSALAPRRANGAAEADKIAPENISSVA